MNFLIGAVLLAIVASLGQALFSMASGPGNSTRMVRALTVRVALSVGLFALLMFSSWMGWIHPHG